MISKRLTMRLQYASDASFSIKLFCPLVEIGNRCFYDNKKQKKTPKIEIEVWKDN